MGQVNPRNQTSPETEIRSNGETPHQRINRTAFVKVVGSLPIVYAASRLPRISLDIPETEETGQHKRVELSAFVSAGSMNLEHWASGPVVSVSNLILSHPDAAVAREIPDFVFKPHPSPPDISQSLAVFTGMLVLPALMRKLGKTPKGTGTEAATQGELTKLFKDLSPLFAVLGGVTGSIVLGPAEKLILSAVKRSLRMRRVAPGALIDPLMFIFWYTHLALGVKDTTNEAISMEKGVKVEGLHRNISVINCRFHQGEGDSGGEEVLASCIRFAPGSSLQLKVLPEALSARLDYYSKRFGLTKTQILGFKDGKPSIDMHCVPNCMVISDGTGENIAVSSASWAQDISVQFTPLTLYKTRDGLPIDPLYLNAMVNKLFAISPDYWQNFTDEQISQLLSKYQEQPDKLVLQDLLTSRRTIEAEAPLRHEIYERVLVIHDRYRGIMSPEAAMQLFLVSTPEELRRCMIFRPGCIYAKEDKNIPDRKQGSNLTALNVLLVDGQGNPLGYITMDQNRRFQPHEIHHMIFELGLLEQMGLNPDNVFAMALDEHGGGGVFVAKA